MSAKNRAIGDTENEFQAALATYTKAGNKTAAMRRLWNAAYEMGRLAAEGAAPVVLAVEEGSTELVKEKKSKQFEEAKRIGFVEGRQAGFEDGRESAMTADAFALSFQAGKTAGLASGRELGRETEEQRWKDAGHFTDGMCRTFDDTHLISPAPRQSFPPDTSTNIPGAFNWADDAESLPIHTVLSDVRQPRDLSDLRSGSTNPFDTLQRRHARYHGARTRSRQTRQHNFYSARKNNSTRFGSPQTTRQSLVLAPRSKAISEGQLSVFGFLVWFWMVLRERVALG
ncbi:hypothetical protein B0H13DRAFT_1999042 [Mycena leptocephala]|nr:hypothetical protein B0H13DRAFT_1999042 [Mycena leptocephala]